MQKLSVQTHFIHFILPFICIQFHHMKAVKSSLNNTRYGVGTIFIGLIILALVAGIIALVIVFIFGRRLSEYAIVIDAGSSSSKLMLYSWPSRVATSNAPVSQIPGLCRTKLGISAYENQVAESSQQILDCLKTAPFSNIEPKEVAFVNLYLGATAGMRMLSHSNGAAADAIYTQLRQDFSKLGFAMGNDISQRVRTITGEEEAITAWISVNYLKSKFGKTENGEFRPMPARPEETLGSLDLGGASTQITFVPAENDIPQLKKQGVISETTLFGQTYPVFGFSHLCYGKNQVEMRHLAMLVINNNNKTNVQDPCLSQNVNVTMSAADIFTAPCVRGKFALDAFGVSIEAPVQNLSTTFTFQGTGKVAECTDNYIKPLFLAPQVKKAVIPPLRGKFQAFAAFYLVADYLKLAPTATLPKWDEKISTVCSTTPQEPGEFVKWFCFDAIYVKHLLMSYGFNATNWQDVEFVNKIDNNDVSWSLGFMIDQSGHLLRNMPENNKHLSLVVFVVLVVLLTLLLVLLSVGSLIFCCWRRHQVADNNMA